MTVPTRYVRVFTGADGSEILVIDTSALAPSGVSLDPVTGRRVSTREYQRPLAHRAGGGDVYVLTPRPVVTWAPPDEPASPVPGTVSVAQAVVLDEWLAMPEWGKLPADSLQDLGRRYLTAPTPDAGIDDVLPDLIDRPNLFEPVARLIELEAGGHGAAGYDAALLRATAHALAGERQAAEDLVWTVRPLPEQVTLSWLHRLGELILRYPEHTESVNGLRAEMIRCASAQP